jgi:hypothetical protein
MARPIQRERATGLTCAAALSRLTPEDRAGQREGLLLEVWACQPRGASIPTDLRKAALPFLSASSCE